jgi:hypothetical protein
LFLLQFLLRVLSSSPSPTTFFFSYSDSSHLPAIALPLSSYFSLRSPSSHYFHPPSLPLPVLLTGSKQDAQLAEAAAAKEKAEWKAKIVVDPSQLNFVMTGVKSRDTPILVDRASGMLKGGPQTLALKMLINGKKTSTGKVVTYEPMPLSVFADCPYSAHDSTGATLREVQVCVMISCVS